MGTLGDLHEDMNETVPVPPAVQNSQEFVLERPRSLHTAPPSQWSIWKSQPMVQDILRVVWPRPKQTEIQTLKTSLLTLHDMLLGPWIGFEVSGEILADNRVVVEKLEVGSLDEASMSVVSLAPHRSDRAPEIVVEDSIDLRHNSEDSPSCRGTRHGDPFW
jgi:hypothetical protein